jgi:hypothetical protein
MHKTLGIFKRSHRRRGTALGILFASAVGFATLASAQDRDRDRDRDQDRDRDYRVRTLDPGTVIPVRLNESIDVDKGDNRVYMGNVDQDVRNDNGRMVIPRGANVELMVRYTRDNDLILDMESITVNGQRYAIRTEPKRMESRHDDSLVGSIVGAINGGEARGRAVRVPRDTVVTFRLTRPLDVGVDDRGVDRDGRHYHDWYRPPDRDHDHQ